MNKLLTAFFCLVSATAFAANPAFGDFNVNQFGVSGNKVVAKSGILLTNHVDYGMTTIKGANGWDSYIGPTLSGLYFPGPFFNSSVVVGSALHGSNGVVNAGAPQSAWFSFIGGSTSSTMDQRPIGELWPNMTNAWIGIWDEGTNVSPVFNQAAASNLFSYWIQNKVTEAWTNAGFRPVDVKDSTWQGPLRVNGFIVGNPALYLGSVSNFVASVAATQFVDVVFNNYFQSTNAQGKQLLTPFQGNPTYTYPDDSGLIGTNIVMPAITVDTVRSDVEEFYKWGAKGILIQDMNPYNGMRGWEAVRAGMFADAIQTPGGLGYNWNINFPNRTHGMWLGLFMDNPIHSTAFAMNFTSPNTLSVSPKSSSGGSYALAYIGTYNKWMKTWPETSKHIYPIGSSPGPLSGENAYTTNDYKQLYSAYALYQLNVAMRTPWNVLQLVVSTNQGMLRMHQHPNHSWPSVVYDGGTNSVHLKHYSETEKGVLFANEGTGTTNLFVTQAMLGFTNGSTVSAREAHTGVTTIFSGSGFTNATTPTVWGLYTFRLIADSSRLAKSLVPSATVTNLTSTTSSDSTNSLKVTRADGFPILEVGTYPALPNISLLYFGIFGTAPSINNYTMSHSDGGSLNFNVQSTANAFDFYANTATLYGSINNQGFVGQMKTNPAAYTIVTTDFVSGALYTNRNQRAWVQISPGTLPGAGTARMFLWIDQDGNGVWERTGINVTQVTGGSGMTNGIIGAHIQPLGRFTFTNQSSGGGVSYIEAGSSEWVFQ
jgi:hypothetical protein